VVTIVGVSGDKDAREMVRLLEPVTGQFIFTQYAGHRAMAADDLAALAASPGMIVPALEDALAAGIERASAERPLLVTGSIFLAGEAREILVRKYGAKPLRF
jgi:dihydrofolate synthase / folylpolyglutamate synthase